MMTDFSFIPVEYLMKRNNDDLENGTHVHRASTRDWTGLDFPVNFCERCAWV